MLGLNLPVREGHPPPPKSTHLNCTAWMNSSQKANVSPREMLQGLSVVIAYKYDSHFSVLGQRGLLLLYMQTL